MVYIATNLSARRRQDLEPPGKDFICVEVQTKFNACLVVNCYRVQAYKITHYCQDIEELYDIAMNEFEDIVFLGDMNARNSEFWNGDIINIEGQALHTLCARLGKAELIHKPTRIVNRSKSCIDLILYNKPQMVVESGAGCKIAEICDHCPIYVIIKFNNPKP